MRILTVFLQAFTAAVDWYARPSSGARRFFTGRWIIIYLSPVLLALLFLTSPPVQNALKERALRQAPLPIYVTRFRERLPAEARVDGNIIRLTCKAGDNAKFLARRYYEFSSIFAFGDLEEAFKKENPALAGGRCKEGTEITVPGSLTEPLVNKPLGWPDAQSVRAIYVRGDNTSPARLAAEVARAKAAGANAVVFDVKDVIGVVNYRSDVPIVEELRQYPPPIPSLVKTIRFLHDQGFYVIARTALFQDENLARKRPDLAIKDAGSPSGILLVKGRPLWVDPGRPEVRQYNFGLVIEMAGLGVDEIQFDYVRYPAEGNLKQVTYYDVKNVEDKTGHLKRFLELSHTFLEGSGTRLAIDIFGVVAWGEDADVRTTGQRIKELAPHVDVISPMLYPSHFNAGFDGYTNPADQGFHFYNDGVRRVLEMSGGSSGPVIRPWVQAFKWRVTNYNELYVLDQIKGTTAGGGVGWMMWNAANDYNVVYRALTMKSPAEYKPPTGLLPGRKPGDNVRKPAAQPGVEEKSNHPADLSEPDPDTNPVKQDTPEKPDVEPKLPANPDSQADAAAH